jgi:hypothetical protein
MEGEGNTMRLWVPCLALAVAVTSGLAVAQSDAPADQPKKYHSVDAEVVAANTGAMTITVKVAGEEHTNNVSALAKTRLGEVKAGDKVVLSCKDVAGGHREVVAIRAARAAAAKEK